MSLGRERSSVFRIQWRQNIRIWIVKVTQSQNKTWPQEFKVSKQNIVTRICMLCAGIWRLGHENFFWRLFCVTCVCMCEQKRISLERIKERRMRCGGENIIIYCRNRRNKREVQTKESQGATTTSIHLLLLTTNNAQTEERKIEQPKKKDVSC